MGYNAQKPKLLTQSMLTSSRLSVRKTSKARAQAMTAPGQLQNKCAWENMADNSSVVSEWKENFRLSQPTPSLLFGCILFHLSEAMNMLVNHSIMNFFFLIMNVSALIVVYKTVKKYPFSQFKRLSNPSTLKLMIPETLTRTTLKKSRPV